jgi:hypothetical protein
MGMKIAVGHLNEGAPGLAPEGVYEIFDLGFAMHARFDQFNVE